MGLPYYVAQQYAKLMTNGTSLEFRNTLINNGAVRTNVEKCFSHSDDEEYYREYYTLCGITFVYSEMGGITLVNRSGR